MNRLRIGLVVLVCAFALLAPQAPTHAQAPADTLKMIQELMTRITELQKQLSELRGEARGIIADGLKEGMTSEDIGKLQKLLATDPTIYPEGRVTKFYGPLTKEAVKRFQMRHELTVTGEVTGETRALLEEYLSEGFGDQIPPGLLRAPGIMKKVEMRYELKCDKSGKGAGMGPLCKKLKVKYESEDDDVSDEEDYNVEVEVENGETTVSFDYDGKEYEIDIESTDSDDIYDAIEDELDADLEDLDADFVAELKKKVSKKVNDYEDDLAEYDVEVEVEGGTTTVSFEYDNDDYEVVVDSTDEDDILDAIADELDEDLKDLDDDFVDAVEDALDEARNDDDDEARQDAEDAIEDAEDAIDDAEDAIDDASGDTEEAEDLLDEAQDKLDDAEDALDDEDYEDAEDLADEAKELAEDAEDAL